MTINNEHDSLAQPEFLIDVLNGDGSLRARSDENFTGVSGSFPVYNKEVYIYNADNVSTRTFHRLRLNSSSYILNGQTTGTATIALQRIDNTGKVLGSVIIQNSATTSKISGVNHIIGLSDPLGDNYAANKNYVDNKIGSFIYYNGNENDTIVQGEYAISTSTGSWIITPPSDVITAKVTVGRDNVGSNASISYQTRVSRAGDSTVKILGAYTNQATYVYNDLYGEPITISIGNNVTNSWVLVETLRV